MIPPDSNAEAAEIAHFDSLAARWWDPSGPLRTLHEINPLRVAYILEHAPVAGRRVLDVGCGGGLLSEPLAAQGAQVTGIDLADASIAVARSHADESHLEIEYLKVDIESHCTARPDNYDLVTCLELLEHVPDPAALVSACARTLKPGGTAIFSTINRSALSFAFAIVAAEYLSNLVPRGTHEYAKLIRPSELAAWCRTAGLSVTDITGMSYDPLTRRHRLGVRPHINYLCCVERPDTA